MTQTEMDSELEFLRSAVTALANDGRSLLASANSNLFLAMQLLSSVEVPEDNKAKEMLQQAQELLERYIALRDQLLHDWKEFHGQGD